VALLAYRQPPRRLPHGRTAPNPTPLRPRLASNWSTSLSVATTFIYVTHDQVEAMTMATRIAVMSEGRL
jgi:hypothetical protein